MPKALKSSPKSKKSPDLVTLVVEATPSGLIKYHSNLFDQDFLLNKKIIYPSLYHYSSSVSFQLSYLSFSSLLCLYLFIYIISLLLICLSNSLLSPSLLFYIFIFLNISSLFFSFLFLSLFFLLLYSSILCLYLFIYLISLLLLSLSISLLSPLLYLYFSPSFLYHSSFYLSSVTRLGDF